MYRLVKPDISYQQKFLNYIKEWGDQKVTPINFEIKDRTYEELLTDLYKAEHDIHLPDGYVPESSYFFVDKKDEIVGLVNIRHYLDEILFRIRGHIAYGIRPSRRGEGLAKTMLRHALKEASHKGIKKVLMVSDKVNLPSAKTIVACGGVLDNEIFDPTDHEVIQRYWIDLT